MARIHGSRGQVKMDPAGGASGVVVANLNAWTLDMSRDRVDVTSFGDTNKTSVQGLPNYSGTLSGFWDATSVAIFQVALGTVAPFLTLIPDSLAPTFLFKGLAWLDASINVSANGAVTIGGKFDAAGPWVMAP